MQQPAKAAGGSGILYNTEMEGVYKTLDAAALTYVALPSGTLDSSVLHLFAERQIHTTKLMHQ